MCFLLVGICSVAHAQATFSVVGGYGVGLTENNYLSLDPNAAWLGRVTMSNSLGFRGFRYNLGLEYGEDVWAMRPVVQGGISMVLFRPSGFIKAATAEDVSYHKTKAYLSIDVNSYHGATPVEDTWLYQWGIEPAVVMGRQLGRQWILTGTASYRMNWCPAYTNFGEVTAYSGVFAHVGLLYSMPPKRYKPN